MTNQHQVHKHNLDRRGPEWRVPTSGHTCGWPGCEEFIAGRLWGCREHWLKVPMHLRDEYMEAGAGRAWNDPNPHHLMPAVVLVETKILIWVEMAHGGG
jgi:hypothetical protein